MIHPENAIPRAKKEMNHSLEKKKKMPLQLKSLSKEI